MRRLRLLQVLLCLVLWTRSCDGAARKTCLCNDVEKLKGLHPDRPCVECATGYYRTCTGGAYYAHHPTMCIYATRQEDFTHGAADDWCTKYDGGAGFLAFVGSLEESYDVSHFVWNSLKNGVEGNETYFWVGGKFKRSERTNETFWLFEYHHGYYDVVPRELLPDNAELAKAIHEGRTCLAGHTENYTKLYPMHCDEKLPAVCYNYRQIAKHFCEQVDGKVWTLFQGKCYYVYSAPTRSPADYRTYFDAQKECGKMGAILATVTDEATFKRTLDLATGLEKIVDIDDGTWIGLQLSGRGYGGIYYYPDGTKRDFVPFRDPNQDKFPAQLLPLTNAEGWWEDGTPYNPTALQHFWAHMVQWVQVEEDRRVRWEWDQPNEEELRDPRFKEWFEKGKCEDYPENIPDDYNLKRCREGKFEHCTQIFPGSTEEMPGCPKCKAYGYKWNDRWCYFRQRGYICQRDAVSEEDPYRLNDEL